MFGIETDGLFTIGEQRELAEHIPDAKLILIESPDGHDGFLLEFEQINTHIINFLRTEFPDLYKNGLEQVAEEDFEMKKTSMFGEAEADDEVFNGPMDTGLYGEPPADVARW